MNNIKTYLHHAFSTAFLNSAKLLNFLNLPLSTFLSSFLYSDFNNIFQNHIKYHKNIKLSFLISSCKKKSEKSQENRKDYRFQQSKFPSTTVAASTCLIARVFLLPSIFSNSPARHLEIISFVLSRDCITPQSL